ncbi:MAG: serine/threonine protein kinase [Myxococcales bacterium]|nr:serine/threonine protein kinase [Myxococcales bacterium]MCB9702489.1 serine/threonine protein kinase [Myxococcales bacterium]
MEATGLARYQIMESLGQGSQGQTFRGIDRASGDEVAIKVLRIAGLESWKGFDLFERECDVLAALDHPGIPRYIDRFTSEQSGELFLVREMIEGESLRRYVETRRPLDEATLVDLLRQALAILDYLHSRVPPVIHRDIKPGNFIRRADGRLVLIDFGGVRISLSPEGGSTMIGTYGYMAPEQLHGEVTPATDIFALGATIAALATGREGDKLPRKGLRIDLSEVMRPSRLRDVLGHMLAPEPGERPPSAADVLTLLGDDPQRAMPPRSPRAAPPRAEARDEAVDEHALAVGDPLQTLARVPRPLSIIVWLFAALVTGVLVLVEVALLPAAFAIFRALKREGEGEERLAEQQREAIKALREGRRSFQALAASTRPTTDDDDRRGG